MNAAQQQTGGTRYTPEEELQEIIVTAQKIYPGRTWDELSQEEKTAAFASYKGKRAMANNLVAQGSDMMAGAGKEVGPYNVYVNNPWESLAGGLMAGAGYGMQGKANRQEAQGREAMADLQTNRDARDREYSDRQTEAEERRRREWLETILGR